MLKASSLHVLPWAGTRPTYGTSSSPLSLTRSRCDSLSRSSTTRKLTKSFGPSFFLSSNTDIELVRITVVVAVDGPSADGALGVAGGGLATSCAELQLNEITQAAAMAAHTRTLMLTPNLPLLR